MHEIFVTMLNLSLTSCLVVVAIALIRLVFRKAPKKIICALWILVAVRLLCPVFIPSPISVYNIFEFESNPRSYFEYNRDVEITEVEFNTETTLESDEAVKEGSFAVQTFDFYFPTLMRIWFIGTIVMIVVAVISYVRLRYTVRASIKIEDGIFICDEISTPFILGIIRPVIYLPTGIALETKSHVIAHERAHIKRGDFIWKPLSYLILCLYWFNPFIWLAFILFCRDMEMACDEKVIKNMDKDFISRYSEALLNFASGKRLISVCPLAFGEVGVKQRIKSILKYKRSGKIVIGIVIALGIAIAAVFLTGPASTFAIENQEDLEKKVVDETRIPYTDFVGDNSTVSAIVSHMTFPEGLIFDHIELDTSEEPYGLTIVLSGSGDKDFDQFSKNADLAFEHIGNLSSVMFINKDTGELISVASKGTYLPIETIPNPNVQGKGSADYLPSETIIKHSSDGTDSNDAVDYIYNIDADPNTASEENTTTYIVDENADIYSSYRLRDMVMGFYKGYINGDLKMVQISMAKISSMKPTVFEGNPGKVSFLGIVDADKVVSGESNIMYIAFEDKNNDEGTKKFLELHITKEPDGWKVFGYDTIIEN